MTKRFYLLFFSYLGIILLTGVACELSTGSSSVAGENTLPSGSVLFQDDFVNNNNNWDTWNGKEGSKVVLEDETLHIVVQESQYDYWSLIDNLYSDVRIDVTVAKLGGPDDNDFGVLCRYQDKDNYYALLISSDGYAGILKVKQGMYTLLGNGFMEYNEAVSKGDAVNLLRVECVGQTLKLTVNGKKVIEAQDGDIQRGQVGVIAGTTNTPGTSIYFDNFIVYQP